MVLQFKDNRSDTEILCPCCSSYAVKNGKRTIKLNDVPISPGLPTVLEIEQRRFRCLKCGKSFKSFNPFKFAGCNLTGRCVDWINKLMRCKVSTSAIAEILGIHWNTVRKIEQFLMEDALRERDIEMRHSDYRPTFLAVDEFAIRKGHRYATCVMDIENGEILWVGTGRTIKDFRCFFETFSGTDYLSQVKAVAMDMNASYNTLVRQYLPQAVIVYDRYHVQAQFGREVLGQVRLDAARRHKENAKELSGDSAAVKEEKKQYSKVKKARWMLLQNNENLSCEKQQSLKEILDTHSDLAVCYAMKEELCDLFMITDKEAAAERWEKWFAAAATSGIAPLVRFARQKQARIDGLVSHAVFPINTGRLEGINNKIKVAKRNAYGFRNNMFFFTLIRFGALKNRRLHQYL